MPTTNTAANAQELSAKLHALTTSYGRHQLDLITTRKEPPLLEYHVQGAARIDYPGGSSTLVVSASQAPLGCLWFARFKRELVGAPGKQRERLTGVGETFETIVTPTEHPGGMQCAGRWLAVANEGGDGPSIDIYDVSVQDKPQQYARLDLHDKPGAGWVAVTQRGPDDLVLFVGGAKFTTQDSWLYSFRPTTKTFHMEGTFHGKPNIGLWHPQHGGSMFVGANGELLLLTQGTKGDEKRDAFRERVRCYRLTVNGASVDLDQLSFGDPAIDTEEHEADLINFPSPNLRWGSDFFEDPRGDLSLYVTARNPVYQEHDKKFHLQVVEIQHKGD